MATKISMMNAISPVLHVIREDMFKLSGGIRNLENSFEKMGAAGKAAFSALGAAAGTAVVVGLTKLADKGTELLNQQDKLQRSGVVLNDVLKLQADYFERVAKAVPTSTASEYLKTVNELRSVTGSQAAAAALAPRAMMADALISNALGSDQSGAYYKLLRSAEMKGISTDPKKLQQLTDQAFSYITAFGGKLTPQDFQTFAKTGGTAWMNLKPEAFGPAAVAMADLGGFRAGTAMQTLQQLQQGTMTLSKQQAAALEKAGLLDMSKTTKTGFGGGKLQLQPGAILGSLEYMGDLPGWVKEIVYPHMMKAAGGDEALYQNMLGKEAPNRNAAKMIQMFGDKGFRDQIAKDLGLAGQVKPLEQAYQDFTTRNPVGVKKAFSDQFESMLSAIGAPLMLAAMPVMKNLTSMFTSIGSLANSNPELIQSLGKLFAQLGAIGIGAGAGSLIGLLFGPPGAAVGGLVGALIASITALAALNWDTVSTGFNTIKDAITKFAEWLHGIGQMISDWITTLGGLLKKASFGGGGLGGGGGLINASYGGQAGGGAYNVAKAYDLMKAQGATDEEARTFAALAQPESGGNPLAHNANFRTGDNSYGLWQINMLGAMGPQRRRQFGLSSNEDLYDPATNARVALAMHRRAGGYRDWSTYNSGAYRKYMSTQPHAPSYKGQQTVQANIHNPVYLDGKMIASNSVTHILKSSEHSRGAAYFDGYHTFAGADRQTATA